MKTADFARLFYTTTPWDYINSPTQFKIHTRQTDKLNFILPYIVSLFHLYTKREPMMQTKIIMQQNVKVKPTNETIKNNTSKTCSPVKLDSPVWAFDIMTKKKFEHMSAPICAWPTIVEMEDWVTTLCFTSLCHSPFIALLWNSSCFLIFVAGGADNIIYHILQLFSQQPPQNPKSHSCTR